MVISSLIVTTISGTTEAVAEVLAKTEGVEVHEIVGFKIVVTIEAETVDDSAEIANGFNSIMGVLSANLVYVNFEDDPSLQRNHPEGLSVDEAAAKLGKSVVIRDDE